MKRRTVLFALAVALVLPATAAQADDDDPSQDWVDWLEESGYRDIAVARTLLGRTYIRATLGEETREIVLNPRTGEVLRDVWIDEDGNARPAGGPPAKDDDSHAGHGGSGNSDGDDDGGHGND